MKHEVWKRQSDISWFWVAWGGRSAQTKEEAENNEQDQHSAAHIKPAIFVEVQIFRIRVD